MTAVHPKSSADDSLAKGDGARRAWRPMTLEYVGNVGDVMKSTHKTGSKGETDIFTVKRP